MRKSHATLKCSQIYAIYIKSTYTMIYNDLYCGKTQLIVLVI